MCVSDVGLYEASGGGGYDTHTDNAHDTARNFDNVLRSLAQVINEPGESDPKKLDLDDTLIILNTEFGRTPVRQDGGSGRNHHPYGYVTAFIGGPIRPAERHRRRDRSGRHRDTYATPARTGSPRCSRSASGRSRRRPSRSPTCAAPAPRRTPRATVTRDILGGTP